MLSWFISTSVLIAVVLLVRRLLRDRIDPRLTYALWLLAALRVCIPVSLFTAPVSVSGLVEGSGLTEAVEEVREVISPKQTMTFSVDPASGTTLEEYAQSWSDAGLKVYDAQYYTEEEIAAARQDNPAFYRNTDNLPVRLTVEKLVGGRSFWSWVYLTGVWVTLIVLGWTNRGFHKRAKQFRKPYEGELPVPCPLKVYELADLPSPCLYTTGFRPAIYLNRAAVESQHLDHVLTHELTHYRHKDHWWADVRLLCLCIQWFNPLVWLAAYLSRQDCELACDASVIKRLGEDHRLSYGRTLVDMIASTRSPGAFLRPATTMTSGKRGIAQRIQLIVKRPKMTAVTLVAVLLVAALAVGCTFGGAEKERGTPLEDYFGSTYTMAGHTGEALVGPIAISYSPTQGSIGELTITGNFFGCFDKEGLDWGENVTDPIYTKIDFDQSAYGQSDRFYPALDDFFGRYESITVYEIENASKPLHLLILDGELWLAINVGEVNCYILRLEEYVAPSESDAPEYATQLPAIDEPNEILTAEPDPAELAQSVYAAIVGDHNSRDFYMEITDGPEGDSTTTRIHMTAENDWNLSDDVSRYQWAYAVSDGSEASLPITVSTPDGSIRLRCWADSNRVIIEKDGNTYFLTAREPDNQDLVVRLHYSLLQAANDALITEAHSSIVIDGAFTDHETVVEEYARRYAANLNALPDWVPDRPGETVYRTSGVSQAYSGEGTENFCAFFGFYLSPEMGNSTWQAGSGMDEETEGEFAGWWKWGMGADFARNSDGDWACTGMYTGGEMLEFPTPLEEATMEQLVHYFYYTSGMNHEYLIPYTICRQPAASAGDLNRLLQGYDDPAALCTALGAFLRDYGEYEDILLTYDVLSNGLDSQYSDWLTVGYTNVGIPE